MTQDGWISALSAYAERLHAASDPGHHVVSALGAWMLVALCAPLADDEGRGELAEVLHGDPIEAAHFAAELLATPHPLVAAGAGVWMVPAISTPAMEEWRDGLPDLVSTGDIPTQEALDTWAEERTLGLIKRFPIEVTPELVCLLATALATKVSWEVPFEVIDAAQLGPNTWSTDVQHHAIASMLPRPTGRARSASTSPVPGADCSLARSSPSTAKCPRQMCCRPHRRLSPQKPEVLAA